MVHDGEDKGLVWIYKLVWRGLEMEGVIIVHCAVSVAECLGYYLKDKIVNIFHLFQPCQGGTSSGSLQTCWSHQT